MSELFADAVTDSGRLKLNDVMAIQLCSIVSQIMPRSVPTGQSTSRAGPARAPARVLETLKHDAMTELGGVLSGFWSSIEEQVRLAALAGHDYVAAQEDRVAVMAALQITHELFSARSADGFDLGELRRRVRDLLHTAEDALLPQAKLF